jgi:hypothetical protein
MNTLTYLIEKHPDKPWNRYGISQNPNITMEMIEKHSGKPRNGKPRNRYSISLNPNLTMEMIEKHPEKPWGLFWISCNPLSL